MKCESSRCENWCCQTGLNCRPLHYQWRGCNLLTNRNVFIPFQRNPRKFSIYLERLLYPAKVTGFPQCNLAPSTIESMNSGSNDISTSLELAGAR